MAKEKFQRVVDNKFVWIFNWIGGGYNCVFAHTKGEALKEIKKQFSGKNDILGMRKLVPNLVTLHKATISEWDGYNTREGYWD